MGKYEVGKTTLVKRILPKNFFDKVQNLFSKNERTDGIEMHQWVAKDNVIIEMWDFGGQKLFYTTHQFFLSEKSIVLLVFKLSDENIEPELSFWLNSISCRSPKCRVMIVGTFMDKIEEQRMEKEILSKSKRIKEIYDTVMNYIEKENRENLLEIIPCNSWNIPKEKKNNIEKLWFWPISLKKEWNVEQLEKQIKLFCYGNFVRK